MVLALGKERGLRVREIKEKVDEGAVRIDDVITLLGNN